MSTTPHHVLHQARQGNPDAIAALMNQHLQTRGITAQVSQQGDALYIALESAQAPAQHDLVTYIKKGVSGLSLAEIHHLEISGKQTGQPAPDWTESIVIQHGASPPPVQPDVPAASPLGDAEFLEALSTADDLELHLEGEEFVDGLSLQLNGQSVDEGLETNGLDLESSQTLNGNLDVDLDETNDRVASLSEDNSLDLDLAADSEGDNASVLDLDLDESSLYLEDGNLEELDLDLANTPSSFTDDLSPIPGDNILQDSTDELNAALSDLDMPDLSEGSGDHSEAWDQDLNLNEDLDLEFDTAAADLSLGSADEDLTLDADLDLGFDTATTSADDAALESVEFDFGFDSDTDNPDDSGLASEPEEVMPESLEIDDLELDSSFDIAESSDFSFGMDGAEETLEEGDLSLDLDAELDRVEPVATDLNLAFTDKAVDDSGLDFTNGPNFLDPSDLSLDVESSSEIGAEADLDLDLDLDLATEQAEDFSTELGPELELDEGPDVEQSGPDMALETPDALSDDGTFDLDLGEPDALSALFLEELEGSNLDSDFGTAVEDLDVEATETADLDQRLDMSLDDLDIAEGDLSLDLSDSAVLEDLDDTSSMDEALADNGEEESAGKDATESVSIPLGDDLGGDLWSDDAAEPPIFESSQPQTTDDIEWVPIQHEGKTPDDAAIPEQSLGNEDLQLDEEASSQTLDWADSSDTEDSAFQPQVDPEPVDLMLSEDLNLSAEDNEQDVDDIAELVDGIAVTSDSVSEMIGQADQSEALLEEHELDAAAMSHPELDIATAEAIPQSPIHKLLSEDAVNLDVAAAPEAATDLDEGLSSADPDDDLADLSEAGGQADAFAYDLQDEGIADIPLTDPDTEHSDLGEPAMMAEGDAEAEAESEALSFADQAEVAPGFDEAEPFTELEPPGTTDVEAVQAFDETTEDPAFDLSDSVTALDAPERDSSSQVDDMTSLDGTSPVDEVEPGLRPEDFPLFNHDAKAGISPAEAPLSDPAQALSSQSENIHTVDTFELNSVEAENSDRSVSEDLTVQEKLPPDSAATMEEATLAAAEPESSAYDLQSSLAEDASPDESFMDEGFDATDFDGTADFSADNEDDWAENESLAAADEFIEQATASDDEFLSTSVNLTDEDLDHLDNPEQSSGGGAGNWLVGLGLGVVCLGLLGILFNTVLGNRQPTEPVAQPPVEMPVTSESEADPEPAEGEDPDPENPEDPETPVAEESEPDLEAPTDPEPASVPEDPAEALYFRDAVNAAQNAANLAQTASTKAEWQAVADSWARAIDLMKQVPASDPNYATAQQKAVDYQPNLEYAQQNAE
jgi:pilus assembly protein FimV